MSTFSWNTPANADWATAADWTLTSGSTAAPPGNTLVAPASDVATIIGSGSTAFTVSIATGEIFDIATLNDSNVSSTAAPTLSITGTLKLNTLAYSGSQTVTTAIKSGGVLVLRTAITDSGAVQTITINSGGTLIGAGLVATGVALSGLGTVEASGGTLDIASAVTALLAIDATTASDLKIDSFGTSRAPIAISSANQTLEMGAAGNLTINGSAAQSVTNGEIKLDGGKLTDTNGVTVGSGATLTGNGTVSGALTLAGGTLTGTGGTLSLTSVTGFGTVNGNPGVSGAITASGGVLDLTGSPTAGSFATINTGTAADLKVDGTVSTSSIGISGSGQTFEVGNNGSATLTSAESITNGEIKLDGGKLTDTNGVTVGSGATLTGNGTVSGAITLAGGTLTGTGGTLSLTSVTGFGTVNGNPGISGGITASGGVLDLTGSPTVGSFAIINTGTAADLKVDGTVSTSSIGISGSGQTFEVGNNGSATLTSAESITNGEIKLDGGKLTGTNGVTVGSGATLTGNGTVGGAITLAGGTLTGTGGTLSLTSVTGFGTVNGNPGVSGAITASGGVLDLTGSPTAGSFDIASGATLELDGTVAPSTTATFLNDTVLNGTLLLDTTAALTSFETSGTVDSMNVGSNLVPTDQLDLRSITSNSVGSTTIVNGDTIELFSSSGHTGSLIATFDLGSNHGADTKVDWTADGNGGTDIYLSNVVCYSAGTHILTASGERMVESLTQGDIVLTVSGEKLSGQPVRWLGRRRIDLTAHPRPETVAPVRVQRGAFSENMPHTDLLVSPDHAVFVDGKLICARQLINGTTIRQEMEWVSVEYFHVELDKHAILLAEGLPAESYLNTGNRGFFANSGEPLVLHPDLTDEADFPAREAGSCAPFVSDEAHVRPVWQRLAERAAALGQPMPQVETTGDTDLRVVAKGRTLRPLRSKNGLHIFVLPTGATPVRLVSHASAPTDSRPWLDDRRLLGVYVTRIVLRGVAGEAQEVPVDHPSLSQGWWAVERNGTAQRRWTNGDAVLPLPAVDGPTMLEVHASSSGMTYIINVDKDRRAA